MARWLSFAAPIALLTGAPAGALQSDRPAPEYGPIVSAAQDCLDSYKGVRLDPKLLGRRGWSKARLEGFGDLGGIMTAFVRTDKTIMLSTGYSCIIKTRLAAPASADGLAAAISQRWTVEPATAADGTRSWRLPERKIELSPGPSDGSNVSVVISLALDGLEASR